VKIIIYGAYSTMATEVARIFACEKATFVLIGRKEHDLKKLAADLLTRGASSAETYALDFQDWEMMDRVHSKLNVTQADADLCLIAHGVLPDQLSDEHLLANIRKLIDINYTSYAWIMSYWADIFERKGSGHLAIMTSVAGDRGRRSNYIYGSQKAAVSIFAEGLIGRFLKSNVKVTIIKPGMVMTKMTAHLAPSFLFADPKKVARDIVKGLKKKKMVIYTPFFWQIIMISLKLLPARMFHRLKI
jgi:decaprenylphospho-beta-D-erythro-pentofuranosid-2-ulose 2-reductase